MTNLLWMTLPYIAFTSFVLGHIWRYRTDQFGWTTRSSQIYESRLLRLGSPLFHFGILKISDLKEYLAREGVPVRRT